MKRVPKRKSGTALTCTERVHVEKNIYEVRNRYCRIMTLWDMPLQQVFEHLYPPETLALCKAAYAICCDQHKIGTETYPLANGVNIREKMEGSLTPHNAFRRVTHLPGLDAYADQVRLIHAKFELALDVFSWFNRYASANAMRAYCPWVATFLDREWGDRFQEPNGLGEMLPKIRLANEVMANGFLTQAVAQDDWPKHGYTLIFAAHAWHPPKLRFPVCVPGFQVDV